MSGDMMNCINKNPGAIGFADADACNVIKGTSITSTDCPTAGYANVYGPISFNGVVPNASAIQNGLYERFWSLEHLFESKAAAAANPAVHNVVENFAAFAANPANLPTVRPYYTTSGSVQWHKASDSIYPYVPGAYVNSQEY